MSASDSAGSESGAIRKSVLLGSRKARAAAPEKPLVVSRREVAPAAAALPPEVKPVPEPVAPPVVKKARKPAAPRKPKVPPDPLAPLRAELDLLRKQLEERPTWQDLRQLEQRLQPQLVAQVPEQASELQNLREQLQNREEELEELSTLMAELQQQNGEATQDLVRLRREAKEAQVDREHLEHLLAETRQDLQEMESRCEELQLRLRRSEGFLRDALLGLLSPGDDYNEELVEQIQHFLSL